MKICEVLGIPDSGRLIFREPESSSAFTSRLFPRLIRQRESDPPIRLWVRESYPAKEPARALNPSGLTDRRDLKLHAPAVPLDAACSPGKKSRLAAQPEKNRRQTPSKEVFQAELLDLRDHQLVERSALRLATLVHDYSDAVIIRDFKDNIIAWNRGAQRMYGYTEDEALGMNVSRLIPKKMPSRAREFASLPAHGNKSAPIVTRRRTRDGRILDVELTFKVLRDEQGVPVELATTERDITRQIRAERELRRLHTRVISAQETERKRLARELHDGVGQILSGVKFRLESLPGKIALSGSGKAKVLELGGFLDHAISEIRRVSKNLMPSELEDLGLEPALRTLCREFNDRAGTQVTVKAGHIPSYVAPELALALFRIAQEALNNIGKHSNATAAAVSLVCKGREIILSVSDNGVGFVPGGGRPLNGRGIGLGTMRERAESVGGVIEFRSSPGVGTKLGVHAPLLLQSLVK